jgi:hypothetical protein
MKNTPAPPPTSPAETVETVWVAGFYSGEGCTHVQQNKTGPRTRFYVNMTIGNTDLECLQRCQAVIGGAIHGPSDRGERRKPMYMLKVGAAADVHRALDLLMPYLSTEKQDQAKRSLEFVTQNQPPPAPRRGWPKGKPRGRRRRGGEPCSKGHPGTDTYEYTNRGTTMQKCRTCQRDTDAARRSQAGAR